jgi:hypothetical protein
MPQEIRIWKVASNSELEELKRVRLDLESKLEEWIAQDISIIDPELLVIGRQIQTDHGGIIDLLCIDSVGDIVILELKRNKTPREVIAQILDYASWVVGLSHDRITDIANNYYGKDRTLDSEFREKFGFDLPDSINNSHRMLIIASEVDSSTERIIQYLSNNHGVSINAITFQCFSYGDKSELISRVFLLEPDDVEYKATTKGGLKRKPNLTYEELLSIAEKHGVGKLYQDAFNTLKLYFDSSRTTRTSVGFVGEYEGRKSVMFNLIPTESDANKGVAFQVYTRRIAFRFGISEDDFERFLPPNKKPWKYYASAPIDYWGFHGYIESHDQLNEIVKLFNSKYNSAG